VKLSLPNSSDTRQVPGRECLKGLGNKEKLLGRVGGMHYIKTGKRHLEASRLENILLSFSESNL